MFPEENIAKAREFALTAHRNQKYGDKPYSYHFDAVSMIVFRWGENAQILSFLHDTVEDTTLTLQEIENEFGPFISKCVDLLTDMPGVNRKERKEKTNEKLSKVTCPYELALVVKAADRLANVSESVYAKKCGLWNMYKKEQEAFKKAVYRHGLCDNIWDGIEKFLSEEPENIRKA